MEFPVLRTVQMPLYDNETIVPQAPVGPGPVVARLFHFACFLYWSLLPIPGLGGLLVRLKKRLWRGGLLFFVATERSLYHPWISKEPDWLFPEVEICPHCGKPAFGHLH